MEGVLVVILIIVALVVSLVLGALVWERIFWGFIRELKKAWKEGDKDRTKGM